MKPERAWIVVVGLLLLAASPALARFWTDNTGKYLAEAELLEIKSDKVVLKKSTGSVITIPITRLSKVDQEHLQSLGKPGRSTGKGARPVKPDPEVIAAWKKVGAKLGWMGVNEWGCMEFHFKRREEDISVFLLKRGDDLPISISPFGPPLVRESPKSLRGLPSPGIPFVVLSSDLDNAGLKELAELTQLQILILSGGPVTDAELKDLADLKQLRSLRLFDCPKVTDAGMKELAGLKQLQSLKLIRCPNVTDAGVKELAGLKQLRSLELILFPKVTDVGVKELAGLKELQSLRLSEWLNTTDAGLKELAGLKQLRSLSILRCPKVTDAGLVHLKCLTKLKTLRLSHTPVTDEGFKSLRQALPNCRIRR